MIDLQTTTNKVAQRLKKRHRKERTFKWLGRSAVAFGFLMVALLLLDITIKALPAFHQHSITVDVSFKQQWLGTDESPNAQSLNNSNSAKCYVTR